MVSRRLILPAALALLALGACDTLEPEGFEERVVVESYQVALEPIAPVRLSRTSAFDAAYDTSALAVRDARVVIELLGEGDAVEAVYPYVLAEELGAGVYAARTDAVVEPLRRYRLRADVPGRDPITAVTLVPDTFRVLATTPDTIAYQSTDQFEVDVSRSEYPGRQNVFVFTTRAVGPLSRGRLTPFFEAILDDEEEDLEFLRLGSSPIINEANYEIAADGTVTIALPWIAVSWYEELEVSINALDTNMYDFIRSNDVQIQGGATLSPGEIPALLTHVEGAAGLFGSYARVSERIYVRRR